MSRLARAACVALALSSPAAGDGTGRAPLPAPLEVDGDLVDLYWDWLRREVSAPASLAWPRIVVEDLPRTVRMALVFPTPARRAERLRIAIAPRTLERARAGDRLAVLGELAHELAHYAMLLRENGWDAERRFFHVHGHHHCDPEYQRLVAHVGAILWRAYHSRDTTRRIDRMIRLACWRDAPLRGR